MTQELAKGIIPAAAMKQGKSLPEIEPEQQAVSDVIPSLNGRLIAGGLAGLLSLLFLLFLNSTEVFPAAWKHFIRWPWNVFHCIFGAFFGVLLFEFKWLSSRWGSFLEKGDPPGWAKLAVPASLDTPEESSPSIHKLLRRISTSRFNTLMGLASLPFFLALIFEVPQLEKSGANFKEVWGFVLVGAAESIVLITMTLVIYQAWANLIDHWKLITISGGRHQLELSESLKLERDRLAEENKRLKDTVKILEERITRGPARNGPVGGPLPISPITDPRLGAIFPNLGAATPKEPAPSLPPGPVIFPDSKETTDSENSQALDPSQRPQEDW